MEIIRKLFDILTSRERRNLYFLFVAVLLMAALQVVSVASIMPFLSVASDPATVQENEYLMWAYSTFEFGNTNTFLVALGLGALITLVLSNTFIVFTTWALKRFVWNRNHSISKRLLSRYLYHPYEYFLTHNSSKLGKNILEEVRAVSSSMIKPALQGAAKGVVALSIIGFLVFIDPVVAVIVALTLGIAYSITFLVVRKKVDKAGSERVDANSLRYQTVNEAFGGIKIVKLRGKEDNFLRQYDEPSKRYAYYQALYQVIQKAPRYILESVAFGGIILIAIFLIFARGDVEQVIPILGLYAFAGYRLMPALQQAFKGLTSVRFNAAAVEELHNDLLEEGGSTGVIDQTYEKSCLQNQLVLDEVRYTYPDSAQPAIKDLSLTINADTTVGFVGKTGSGKTTTVDLILGLLRPQKGSIYVDSVSLSDENMHTWQQNIGYVPQDIYLSDDSIAQNIAFGEPRQDIDMERVKEACKRAHIYDFISDELPEKWNTFVGERGVRISGGQRQRIGIARALYHSPSVLVFDEATSALDQTTEEDVMQAIYELEGDHTILLVSHRLSTVRRADNIFMLDSGEKVEEGTYNELMQRESKFSSMAISEK